MKIKNLEKGITLIALVITIIVLLILAGVTISIAMRTGIMDKAEKSVDKYSEQSAMEKLKVELVNMQAEKVINNKYNQNEFLTSNLTNAGFIVNGDTVIVDGWQFQIDRSVPEIALSLGKGNENKNIKIGIGEVEYSTDWTKATVTYTITYDGNISSINIDGNDETIPEKVDGKYVITKEYDINKTIAIIAKDGDSYKFGNVKIEDITEDLKIYTAEQLATFRDEVNAGRTYEGRTITLMNDIDLNKDKYTIGTDGTVTFASDATQWTPISIKMIFKGTFDGGYNRISGIYINTSNRDIGLFGYNEGTIENVILENGFITSTNVYVGGIVGENFGKVQNCYNNVKVCSKGATGGIVGDNYGEVNKCVNCGKIEKTYNSYNYGGIVGVNNNNGVVSNCYNIGKISGYKQVGRSFWSKF